MRRLAHIPHRQGGTQVCQFVAQEFNGFFRARNSPVCKNGCNCRMALHPPGERLYDGLSGRQYSKFFFHIRRLASMVVLDLKSQFFPPASPVWGIPQRRFRFKDGMRLPVFFIEKARKIVVPFSHPRDHGRVWSIA
jgi:hypothetical protein